MKQLLRGPFVHFALLGELGDADARRPGADGEVPDVGNTVDIANATWSNTIWYTP